MSNPDVATPEEQRALTRDELALTDQSRQPVLGGLSDSDLSALVSRLRDRRNRARDIGDRQGREARGKAEPAGASSAGGNEGTRAKASFLNEALDRALVERDRRQSTPLDIASNDDGLSQADLARRAMELKNANSAQNSMLEDGAPLHPLDPNADPGKKNLAATERKTAPSGALDHAGELPSRERSRTRY